MGASRHEDAATALGDEQALLVAERVGREALPRLLEKDAVGFDDGMDDGNVGEQQQVVAETLPVRRLDEAGIVLQCRIEPDVVMMLERPGDMPIERMLGVVDRRGRRQRRGRVQIGAQAAAMIEVPMREDRRVRRADIDARHQRVFKEALIRPDVEQDARAVLGFQKQAQPVPRGESIGRGGVLHKHGDLHDGSLVGIALPTSIRARSRRRREREPGVAAPNQR